MAKKVKFTGVLVHSPEYKRVMQLVGKALKKNKRVIMNMGTHGLNTKNKSGLGHYINVSIEV